MSHSPLAKPKEKYFLAFFLALIAAAALFVPYMWADQGYFLFYGDFNVQQVPFYQLAHRAVRSGEIYWNFGTDLGANFIGSYSFYLLGSPFFWMTLPFPNAWVPYLMGPLLILKFAFAALTAYAYITRFVNNKNLALMGGLLYAFSGFSVYNVFFNHFHEAIIYFPLLLLSLEWLMVDRRHGPFAFMVALCAISNYYFFFGMCVFLLLYFFARCGSPDWNMFRKGNRGRSFGRMMVVGLEAVIGVLMSAVILLPAVMAITGNTRITSFLTGWGGLVYGRPQIYSYIVQCFFFPPDLPARPVFFPDADVKWSSMAGWMPLLGMTGVFAWMLGKHNSWQKKLLAACLVIAFVPVLNSAFSAFNYNYYARWFYMPLLIMALVTAKGLEDPQVDMLRGWRWSTLITVGITLAIGLYPQGQNSEGAFVGLGLYSPERYEEFVVTAAIALVCAILIGVILSLRQKLSRDFPVAVIALILVVSVGYGSYFIGKGKTYSYDVDDLIVPHLLHGSDTVTLDNAYGRSEKAGEIDDLRIDVYEGMDNTAMFWNMSCINAFHSIVPGSVMEFYDFIGVERTVASRPDMEQYALRGLTSVKYMLDYTGDSEHFTDENGTCKLPGFALYTDKKGEDADPRDYLQNGHTIYENQHFVPYGFTYDTYVTREYLEQYEGADRTALMMKAMVLDEEQIQKYGVHMTDLATEQPYTAEDLTYPFYYQNCTDRAATACKTFATDKNGFTATTALKKDSLVFFSIPYDEGWSATVDGQPVPVEKVNIGFMAVPVTGDGELHTIRFNYRTPGLDYGMLISTAAVLLWLIYVLIGGLANRKNKEEQPLAQPPMTLPGFDEAFVWDDDESLPEDPDGADGEE